MKTAVLVKNGDRLVDVVELVVDLKSRLIGLLDRSSLEPQRAMYLSPCSSIHTFFMKFYIDLVFLNREMEVTRIVRDVGPGRIVLGGSGSWSVLEMASGWFPVNALKVGDKVCLNETEAGTVDGITE